MFEAKITPYSVPYDSSFSIQESPTSLSEVPTKKKSKRRLKRSVQQLSDLQEVLYASDKHSVLLVFQAMDAAGKDSTIRAVMSGINPAGCEVYSFKAPNSYELDHDFLWRTSQRMPQRGRIGIFNRSYYEEVLVVRVHPEFLSSQRLPDPPPLDELFSQRYASIRDHELHLARNGTVILKFFLNVGRDAQRDRFLSRIDDPSKNWKFSHKDLDERELWPAYMSAYERALNETSRPWAPWYAIPADDKPAMRAIIADIIVQNLSTLPLSYPCLSEKDQARLAEARERLQDDLSPE